MRRIFAALGAAALAALVIAPAAIADRGCDPLDARACLLPWPSNHFTVKNSRTDSGVQLRLRAAQFPKNAKGVSAFSPELNRADGFSPGTGILTFVPGLDLKQTGAAPITDLRAVRDRSQPIVVIDAATRKRQLIWSELDAAARRGTDRVLMIHPARNLAAGRRYIVALRNLKDGRGRTIPAGKAFRAMRDGTAAGPVMGRRRPAFGKLFRTLAKAGIDRKSLYLAWDFTVASERNLTERSLAMRDNAFANLGDKNLVDRQVQGRAPAFKLDAVEELAPCGADGCQAGESDQLARKVTGTLTAPCFLNAPGCPVGSSFRFKRKFEQGRFGNNRFTWVPLRAKDNTMAARFVCTIPRAALDRPARAVVYGHDLYGSPDDVLSVPMQAMAQESDMVFCSTASLGYAQGDDAQLTGAFGDLSKLPAFVDRTQQGFLNSVLLARLLVHPQGLVGQPAFRGAGGRPALDTFTAFYTGLGTGGVLGGAVTTIAPDIQRAALVGAGMNFSLILPRSTDYDRFEPTFRAAYPGRLDRTLLLSAYQGIWDRGEGNGYAQNMGQSPPVNTPLHSTLLQVAAGDHRLPPLAAEVEARTIEAVVREPAYDNGRYTEKIPQYDLTPAGSLELGSVLSIWDSGPLRAGGALGTPFAPLDNRPLREGADPHGLLQADPAVRRQQSDFLQVDGKLVDPCPQGRGCRLAPYAY